MKKIFKAVIGSGGGGGGPSKADADEAGRAAAEANLKAQQAAQALQENFRADLSTDNIAQIAPGGEAYASGMDDDDFTPQRRRNKAGGLSTQLGVGGDSWL